MNKLPVLLLKSFVIFPNEEVKLELNNEVSKKVVNLSYKDYNKKVLVLCPIDQKEENPDVSDLPKIGVEATIVSRIILPNLNVRVTLKGIKRVKASNFSNNEDIKDVLECETNEVILPLFAKEEETALRRKVLSLLEEYINLSPELSNDILGKAKNTNSFYKFTDLIATFLDLSFESKSFYMQEVNPLYRAHKLIEDLNLELEVIKLDETIEDKLQTSLEESQKEFILKEKLNQIKELLGEEENNETDSFIKKAHELDLEEKTLKHILHEIDKYSKTLSTSPEIAILRNYIDTFLSLPWNSYGKKETNLNNILKVLNKSHYGLTDIKERIVEYIAAKKRNPNIKSPIICLVGPPGVGKSSIAYAISKSLKKEFYKISVGGLNDPAELLGHRRTYVGASPGKVIMAMQKCGVLDPVILIDEVDKMGKDIKGDPASALLDILDTNINNKFIDNYIEEAFDLSKVLFILTANNINDIPEALKDRLEIINVSGYSLEEKVSIATEFIIPKVFKENLITKEIKFSTEAIKVIINNYTKEAGVRDLNRNINKIIRKIIAKSYMDKIPLKMTIKKNDISKYLGNKLYDNTISYKKPSAGVVNGLAYTSLGGIVLPIEAVIYDGDGKINYTGNLGKIIEESIKVSLSYIKSNAKYLKIRNNLDKSDIHINFLSSAIPKDGPSAGSAVTTALLSLLLGKIVNLNVAMTGEISLKGDILKIGGLKEKIIGAYNNGIKTIFIPKDNVDELDDIDNKIKDHLNIISVSNYSEIYKVLFE